MIVMSGGANIESVKASSDSDFTSVVIVMDSDAAAPGPGRPLDVRVL